MTQAKIDEDLVQYAPSEWSGANDLRRIKQDLEKRQLENFVDIKLGIKWRLFLILVLATIIVLTALSILLYCYVIRKRITNLKTEKKGRVCLHKMKGAVQDSAALTNGGNLPSAPLLPDAEFVMMNFSNPVQAAQRFAPAPTQIKFDF